MSQRQPESETHELAEFSATSAAAGAAVGFFVFQTLGSMVENGDKTNGSTDDSSDDPVTSDTMSDEKIQELIEIQKRQHGGADSIDAFAGDQLVVPAGSTATVTITPREGFTLFAKRVYFDRRQDVEYAHYIDGSEISDNHQANIRSARKVLHGGQIVGELTNNGGTEEVIDYEFEGWAITSEKA